MHWYGFVFFHSYELLIPNVKHAFYITTHKSAATPVAYPKTKNAAINAANEDYKTFLYWPWLFESGFK